MDELDKFLEASWSPTVDVFINISYTKILDIDTINQRFQAEAIIESKWFDPNIKSINDSIDEKKIWKPDLYVENGIKDVKEEVVYRVVPHGKKKLASSHLMIMELRKVTGIFYENLELEDFPLDVQDLTIHVASRKPGYIVNFIIMQDEQKILNISNTLDKSMWKLHHILFTKKEKREYPSIRVSAKVFRIPGFFYWNALLPIFLVSLASLAPFVVDAKMPQSRLSSTCTLMLTSVSIRWTVGRLLPTVSYLTSLDKYSLASMLIITMELLYHATMGASFPKFSETFAYNLDKSVFLFFCGLILLKQILFINWAVKVTVSRNKAFFENEMCIELANEEEKSRLSSLKFFNVTKYNDQREDGSKKPIYSVRI